MVVPLPTTTSRGTSPFTWCSAYVVACKSSSRPSLARRLVFSQLAASPTSFLLEEPFSASHDKSPPRTRSSAPTSAWAQTHGASIATDACGGTNLHVTKERQLAAMQAAYPRKSLNVGLTSCAAIIISHSATRKTQPEALKHPLRRAQA
jgi:hypothetical protein